jgi:hypothetical protein
MNKIIEFIMINWGPDEIDDEALNKINEFITLNCKRDDIVEFMNLAVYFCELTPNNKFHNLINEHFDRLY